VFTDLELQMDFSGFGQPPSTFGQSAAFPDSLGTGRDVPHEHPDNDDGIGERPYRPHHPEQQLDVVEEHSDADGLSEPPNIQPPENPLEEPPRLGFNVSPRIRRVSAGRRRVDSYQYSNSSLDTSSSSEPSLSVEERVRTFGPTFRFGMLRLPFSLFWMDRAQYREYMQQYREQVWLYRTNQRQIAGVRSGNWSASTRRTRRY